MRLYGLPRSAHDDGAPDATYLSVSMSCSSEAAAIGATALCAAGARHAAAGQRCCHLPLPGRQVLAHPRFLSACNRLGLVK